MRYLLCLAGLCSLALPAQAEFFYVNGNTTIQENFDGLASSGSNLTWSNGNTLNGWYSNSPTYTASSGTSTTRALYSFGSSGDRALGIISLGTSTDAEFGFALRNDTGQTLTSFTVQFDGEHWRRSSTNVGSPQTLNFGYRTSATLGTISAAAYNDVASLGFTTPTVGFPDGAIDGNAAVNRISGITDTIQGLHWESGQYLWLRWNTSLNTSERRHGLAIDNFSFSATNANLSAVPEPSSMALVLSATLFAAFRRKRR